MAVPFTGARRSKLFWPAQLGRSPSGAVASLRPRVEPRRGGLELPETGRVEECHLSASGSAILRVGQAHQAAQAKAPHHSCLHCSGWSCLTLCSWVSNGSAYQALNKRLNISHLFHTSLYHIRLIEEPFGRHSEFNQQVKKVLVAHIPKLHSFEVSPDTFIGIQFRRIGRQRLKVQWRRGSLGQKVLNRIAPMDRCPVPDHHHLARNLLQKPLEKLDYLRPLEGALLHHEIKPSLQGNATDGREMLPRKLVPEDGGLSDGSPGANHRRQEIEPRFVHPHDGTLLF